MATALTRLPDERLAELLHGYRASSAGPRRRALLLALTIAFLVAVAAQVAEVDLPRLWEHAGAFFGYFDRITMLESGAGRVWADPAEWFWGWRKWGVLLLDTLLIAYVGTALGGLGGFLLAFCASANLVSNPWARGAARRFLEFCRTVPDIVFALIFVIAFGLGPVPGVLAIAIHSMGALGKLFSEVVENIDMKPVEGANAAGASWPAMVRFAVLPQVLANFISYALLRFEINVRQASVLGFVGAGGIGQDLIEAIRKFYYNDVAALLLLIIVTVMLIDLGTERLRHRLIGALESRA
ncbi:phosphonate ABC transporter, permease protein PhnE [Roseomonas sp. SSH11]|uniref:Phosphonate ABC transporter, permease protein PhnE n=1 Tax=Pararoseomonas baculiformis TaxID=2820812 RepID=A0ABS4AC51_9PROT|nr:phosphonate ABC transporter, permease protein PhnE [Pararoseomonas baculiformis]MBP0444083.1 phosphonate ABC transporter, permease protein PhnE [Pararoseomonas baculiformis]